MDLKRWQQADQLLDEALDRRPEDRAVFLEEACAGDTELRREVESLLQAHQQAGDFIESPALKSRLPLTSPSLVGKKLGPYEVIALLGRGGMGEVYRARDTRLRRRGCLESPAARTGNEPRLSAPLPAGGPDCGRLESS